MLPDSLSTLHTAMSTLRLLYTHKMMTQLKRSPYIIIVMGYVCNTYTYDYIHITYYVRNTYTFVDWHIIGYCTETTKYLIMWKMFLSTENLFESHFLWSLEFLDPIIIQKLFVLSYSFYTVWDTIFLIYVSTLEVTHHLLL